MFWNAALGCESRQAEASIPGDHRYFVNAQQIVSVRDYQQAPADGVLHADHRSPITDN